MGTFFVMTTTLEYTMFTVLVVIAMIFSFNVYVTRKKRIAEASGQSLYLNFFLIEKTAAVKMKIEEKMHSKLGHGYIRDLFIKNVSSAVSHSVSDEKVSEKIASQIGLVVPNKLFELGISAKATIVYKDGPFFVIQITLESIDFNKLLITRMKNEYKASIISALFATLGHEIRGTVEDTMLRRVCERIEIILPEKMRERLEANGLKCNIVVKGEDHQAAFFFDIINRMPSSSPRDEVRGSLVADK